ncbi:MAG: hypothetical protein K0S34_1600 [Bacillales bacterium]|jgi:hypothetical protein|nr:hypothetical protein [Bacillales bacterium]
MFNLNNLNDFEFERLCKDIMERKLGIPLRFYKRGKDGGVDLNDFSGKNKIVVQVKHYINSKYANLISVIKKEQGNVSDISPEQYYICSGLPLSNKNVIEIYGLFSDYMKDTSNIIDGTLINDYLEMEENRDLVEKNYKLWLSASNVLSLINNHNIFIDCEELVCDLEKNSNLYVETNAYKKCLNLLDSQGTIIITGSPGVGKSTLSKMLLLNFVYKGYCVRYSSENSIKDIKNSLSRDRSKKEIILLDDFLGQHYLNLKETQPNEIKTLISFVKKNPNKKLILNSRITILNEASQSNIQFKDLLDDSNDNMYLINLDEMSDFEKAKILYNHVYFNNLPYNYFKGLKENKNYLKIIKHKNYNPRIIEYISKPRNYSKVLPQNYASYIFDKLKNPSDVWEDEFSNRLDVPDRILMYTLYSLSNGNIDISELESAFISRICNESNIDTTINQFKQTLVRLNESVVKIVSENGNKKIGVVNPSINDYLHSYLKGNTSEQLRIINSSIFAEQCIKMKYSKESSDQIKKMLISGSFLRLKTFTKTINFYFVQLVFEYKIFDVCIMDWFRTAIENSYKNLGTKDEIIYADMITKIIRNDNYMSFYNLIDIFLDSNRFYEIAKRMELDQIYNTLDYFHEKYFVNDLEEYEFYIEELKPLIAAKIEDSVIKSMEESILDIISNKIGYIDDSFIWSYQQGQKTSLINILMEEVTEFVLDKIEDAINESPAEINLTEEDIDLNYIMHDLDIEDDIDAVLSSELDDYYERTVYSNESEDVLIEQMFDR